MKNQFTLRGTTIAYQSDSITNLKVVNAIVDWCKEYRITSGKCLCQDDNGQIEAPNLIASIIDDILQFTPIIKDDPFA